MSEIESLIQFWEDSLALNRLLMNPSTIHLVERTIARLWELKKLKEKK